MCNGDSPPPDCYNSACSDLRVSHELVCLIVRPWADNDLVGMLCVLLYGRVASSKFMPGLKSKPILLCICGLTVLRALQRCNTQLLSRSSRSTASVRCVAVSAPPENSAQASGSSLPGCSRATYQNLSSWLADARR